MALSASPLKLAKDLGMAGLQHSDAAWLTDKAGGAHAGAGTRFQMANFARVPRSGCANYCRGEQQHADPQNGGDEYPRRITGEVENGTRQGPCLGHV